MLSPVCLCFYLAKLIGIFKFHIHLHSVYSNKPKHICASLSCSSKIWCFSQGWNGPWSLKTCWDGSIAKCLAMCRRFWCKSQNFMLQEMWYAKEYHCSMVLCAKPCSQLVSLCREKIKYIFEIFYGLNCTMWHRVILTLFGTIVISSPGPSFTKGPKSKLRRRGNLREFWVLLIFISWVLA